MKDLNKEYKIYAADVEATGLLHHLVEQGDKAKLHNLCVMNIVDCNMTTFHTDTEQQRKDIQALLDQPTIFIMHNGICYDKNALKHFGYDVSKVIFVDTLALSWYLDLNRDKHGLENYGEEFGVPKPAIVDWESLTQQDYDHRVQEDVKIQYRTYKKLKSMFEELYGEMTDYEFCTHKVVKYLNFKMEQLEEQQNTKFKVDVPHAKKVIEELEQEIERKTQLLKAAMPKVPEYTKHTRPAKPFKKDGTLSATGEKWRDIAFEYGYDFNFDGEIKVVKKYDEPNPSSTQQVKDWLFSLGWNPKTFKFVKDGDNERKIPQIYVQGSGGNVCQSIVELSEENPELEHLVGLGVLTHRKGCVQGFLDSLQFGEFIEAGASGFTNTLRLKHRKPYVNLPSSRVVYGEEVRRCLISKDGKVLVSADLSSLENKIKFNLQLPYDREYVEAQMSESYDPHLDIAKGAGLLTQEEVDFYKIVKEGFEKSNFNCTEALEELLLLDDSSKQSKIKEISKVRSVGKQGGYLLQYGGGRKKLAQSTKVSDKVAKDMYDAYHAMNWSIKKIADSQVKKETTHGTYQLNPFNNIWYRIKNEKDSFNVLVQGTGSFCLDVWLLHQFKLRESGKYALGDNSFQLLATTHDDFVSELDVGHNEEMRRLINDAMDMTNKTLRVSIPLGCDIQFGHKYSEIH